MGISVVRYQLDHTKPACWALLKEDGLHPIDRQYRHQADLMLDYFADRETFMSALAPEPLDASVTYLSPLVGATQLFAQGLNYATHRAESGLDEAADDAENLIFSKASSSLTGAFHPIVRPKGCELLDYEIELGIVLKADIGEATHITDDNLKDYVGALVLCNDVSARDFMFGAPMLQWFKGKGQRTFCPAGPVLYLLDEEDFEHLYRLELTLKLNGEVKQSAVTDQLIHRPPKTLTEVSAFADLHVGDCILTGTPGGVLAGHSRQAGLAIAMNLTNDVKRRAKFVAAQKKQATFLQPGDVLELTIKTPDGLVDLGAQRNEVVDA
jgi:2-keto-4-pentenoate hydratase/2-oxohepta-3-ene-1,7-dioic acid hydratase in catechol pathway